MAITVRWFGHSTFGMRIDKFKILIDPFFTGNPKTTVLAADVEADFILVTHGHGDHVGDTVAIAQRTGATVIANYEICNWINGQGHDKTHPQHIGGGYNHPFGYVKLTIAHHGSVLPDGSNGGNPAGFLITAGKQKLYFAGDTGLFSSMQLYGDEKIEVAFLPIGDNFTMGPDDALRAVKLLRPLKVVPIHYATWPLIAQTPEQWKRLVEQETDSQCLVIQPGEEIIV